MGGRRFPGLRADVSFRRSSMVPLPGLLSLHGATQGPRVPARATIPGAERGVRRKICYVGQDPVATPEFYSGLKLLYPAIGVLLGLSALFGLAILPRLGPKNPLLGRDAPRSPSRSRPTATPARASTWASSRATRSCSTSGRAGAARALRRRPCSTACRAATRSAASSCSASTSTARTPRPRSSAPARRAKGPQLSDGRRLDRRGPANSYPASPKPAEPVVIIDKQGKVSAFFTGIVDEAILDDALAQVM